MQKRIERKALEIAEAYWEKLGPGLTTGAADDDPSGIATYSQAGAQYGLGFIWMAPWTYPLIGIVQEMCARIGIVTGQGLAATIRSLYSKKILYIITALLFAANSFNIGANLGAMSEATRLLFPALPTPILVIGFALLSLVLQVFTSYRTYVKYLKWLALVLFSYIITAFIIDLDWSAILYHTIIPSFSFSRDTFLIIAAVLGTTISPYLFFWQTSQEVEAKIEHSSKSNTTIEIEADHIEPNEIKDMRIDVWSGMFISNVVMFFIMVVCGSTLFTQGITDITSAAQAAEALRPLAGDAAYLLFAIGIIGSGLLGVPVLAASTSYAVSESMQWKFGLYRKLHEAYAFYGVIVLSMLVGLLLNFIGLDPIKALIYSAFANCLVAPIVLVFIVLIASNKNIMRKHVNSPFSTFMGWFTVALLTVASVGTIIAFFV